MIRVASRNYNKAKLVPPSFVAEQAIVSSKAFEAWVEAKSKSDFAIFRRTLRRSWPRKEICFLLPACRSSYDVLLDDFEPGMKTAEVREIFGNLRPKQVKLIKPLRLLSK